MTLEDLALKYTGKPLSLEEVKTLAYKNEAKYNLLKLQNKYEYIRLNNNSGEIFFHKRKDGLYYYFNLRMCEL